MAVDPKNGNLTPAELTTVDGLPLAVPTANAYRRMQAAAKEEAGVILWIAKPIGGYRSWFVQGDMAVHPALYGLNPASTVPVASQGWSTHGRGTRVDVGSFGSQWGADGAARSDWLIRNASRFGFYREFGVNDPNHFAHDGFTGTAPFPTDSTTTASTGGVTPIQEGFLMALSDAEQTEALEHLRDLSAALGAGNARNPGVVPPAGDVLSNVRAAVSHTVDLKQAVAALPVPPSAKDIAHTVWWDEGVDRGDRDANGNPVLVPMRQELADAKTNTIAIAATGPVDVEKLAGALADRLKLDPAATATAVRDVLAGLTLTAHVGQ